MLLFLIALLLWVLILAEAIGFKKDKDPDGDIPLAFSFLFLAAMVVMGGVAMRANSAYEAQAIETHLNSEIRYLNKEYYKLQIINPDMDRVAQYNEDAEALVLEIDEAKDRLHNPGINGYTCHVYDQYDSDDIQLIKFTIHTQPY